jgi:hypothetical protein
MKTVVFTIGDGNVEIEASGFKGGACDAATKAFEEVLGTATNKKRKAEYYEKPAVNQLKVGGGQ